MLTIGIDAVARCKVVSRVRRLIGTSDGRAVTRQARNTFREGRKIKEWRRQRSRSNTRESAEPIEYKGETGGIGMILNSVRVR
jgi:hypothetical protein